MKQIVRLLFFIFFTSQIIQGQNYLVNNYSDSFINKCIVEIYQDKSDELVFNSNSQRQRLLFDFMKNRVVVEYIPSFKGKKIKSTNELSVFKKYNTILTNDVLYEKKSFNPLKYINSINLKAVNNLFFRIADTDYIMIVFPLK